VVLLGDLTIHGETRPVKVRVEGENGHYRGTAELKQKGLWDHTGHCGWRSRESEE